MIKLNRNTVQSGRKGYNITVRAKLAVSPTWAWVKAYIADTMSKEAYTVKYIAMLESKKQEVYDWVKSLKNDDITFLCFCANNAFCHTHLLIDWLIKYWPDEFKDVRSKGIVTPYDIWYR